MTRQQWRLCYEYEPEGNPYSVDIDDRVKANCSKCDEREFGYCKTNCDINLHAKTMRMLKGRE